MPTDREGNMGVENHHFAIIVPKIDSCRNHQRIAKVLRHVRVWAGVLDDQHDIQIASRIFVKITKRKMVTPQWRNKVMP